VDGFVVERIIQFRQAAIGMGGGSIDFRGALHVESLVRSLVVELLEKIVELGLLLQAVHACGTSGFVFEREMHALMPTILLRMTGSDAFDGDAQTQPPDGEFAEVEQGVGGDEGNAIVEADAVWQAALLEQALKRCKSKGFTGGFQSFAEEQVARSMIGDSHRLEAPRKGLYGR